MNHILKKMTDDYYANNREQKLLKIAKEIMPDIETLKTRNSDSLDFHDMHIATIKRLMEEAYWLGNKEALYDSLSDDAKERVNHAINK